MLGKTLKEAGAAALILCVAISLFSVTLGRCDGGPFWSGNIAFAFGTTGDVQDQWYKAAYMTTGHLGYDTERDDHISATAIEVAVSFSGTNYEVFSSDNALAIGIAAQGPDGLDRFPAAVDWGYLLLLVLDGIHAYPYIQGMVLKCWEWGRNGLFPIETPVSDDVSHWTWEYPSVLTIDSNVTLRMTWTDDTLEYYATIDGSEYHLYSYTPEQTVNHYFKLALHDRKVRLDPFATGTVKWLQFPGAWSADDSEFPESGWITHVAFPSLIMSGESTWTNVNFSYSVDGSEAWLDNTVCWGGEEFPNVGAHYYYEPWSLPSSEPLNQAFFYPSDDNVLSPDTLLWSVDPVDFSVENVIPLPPNYDTVQVYHNGMRLNGELVSMNYLVTVRRTDLNPDVAILLMTAGIKRTNIQDPNDYRVIGTVTAAMCAGQVATFSLTWQETTTMEHGTWEISGFVDLFDTKIYWDTNMMDNEVVNDTVEARELIGDTNGNGIVDIFDAIQIAKAFLSTPASPNWNPDCDLNENGQVDIFDAIIFSTHFGSSIGSGPGQGSRMGGSAMGAKAMLDAGAGVAVDPSQLTFFKGEIFNVNVKVISVTDLLGWEFKLFWNSTMLNCTNAAVQTPTEWQDNAQNYGSGLENGYNATHARFWVAQTASYPAPSFNGSMTIATLTFQALQLGATTLALMETKLGNSTADPIDHTESSGSVSVYYGRYMRSDTQQVNGLSAYKLNIPQSTSSAVNTQSGSGAGALFGIRGWVRHSNGVEQEISLDGQTGTPEATVGGGSAGMRSSTASVAQKALQSTDSLVIRVYVQIAEGPWTLCASFTTEQLQVSTLKATTWTVYYYTFSSYNRMTDRTTTKFYWGTTTYNSRIQNLQFS